MKRGKESPALNFIYIIILLIAIFALLAAVQGFVGYVISQSPGGGCIDSDGGKNYFVAGNTVYKGNLYYDVCTSSSKLKEYSCNWLGKSSSSTYACRTGCSNGACITPIQTCPDGTANNTCSTIKPKFCSSGTLINKCSTCGCASGQNCNTTSQACYTTILTCSDGTANNTCSTAKPKFCNNGILIDKCSTCSCPSGQSCNATSQACYTPETVPNVPSNLRVIAIGSNSVNLSWMDNSNNENGFDIQKSTNNISFSYAATGYNNNSWPVTGLLSGTSYYLKISAFNSAGNSAYSNVVSATTNSVIINQTCSDGTINGNCSAITPLYCQNGVLISNCSVCGCLSGQVCDADGTCKQAVIANCSDGTANNTCSTIQPKFCQSGTLIDKCSTCSCPSGQNCNTTSQVCYIPSNCVLTSSSISSNCASGASTDCEQEEIISMSGTYTGDCSVANYYQIDAQSSDALCKIQFSGGQISGITKQNPTISGGTITGTWTIPSIPLSCSGKAISATAAALWSGVPGAGTLISGHSSTGYFILSSTLPSTCKYLLSYDRDGGVTPRYLAANASRIETMANFPYDGVFILSTAGNNLMKAGTTLDLTTVRNEFAPLKNMAVKPTKLKRNLVRVLLHYPGDPASGTGDIFSDADWNRVSKNFAVLAQVLSEIKAAGFPIDGIAFDNEGPYSGEACSNVMWNYPNSSGEINACIQLASTKNISAYQAKSRARGKQVMSAAIANFSNIRFLTFLDAYFSCTDNSKHEYDNFWLGNELLGSFTLGLAEATVGTNAKVTDGGEYSYYKHVAEDGSDIFKKRYDYRKTNMSTDNDCKFITYAESTSLYPNFRTRWTQTINVGHGLMNGSISSGVQNMATIQADLTAALSNTDSYVWIYMENVNSIDPLFKDPYNLDHTYVGSVWMNKIIAAKNNANLTC